MDEKSSIRRAWHTIDRLCGPEYPGREAAFRLAAQAYSNAVLDDGDIERIKTIGKKHLKLVAYGLLDGEQFDTFLRHVISYERLLGANEE